MEFIAVSRSLPTPNTGNSTPMPRSKPSMTTYMNTANARIAAQAFVSNELSAMAALPGTRGHCLPGRDARGVRGRIRRFRLVRLGCARHELEQIPGAHAKHGEVHDDERDQRRAHCRRREW